MSLPSPKYKYWEIPLDIVVILVLLQNTFLIYGQI